MPLDKLMYWLMQRTPGECAFLASGCCVVALAIFMPLAWFLTQRRMARKRWYHVQLAAEEEARRIKGEESIEEQDHMDSLDEREGANGHC